MDSKVIAITLLASAATIGYSNTSFAEACYNAEGSVTTENITPTLQTGSISLTLSDPDAGPVFSETGALVGSITGTDGIGTTLLSHLAIFPHLNIFFTKGDKAEMVYPFVRATLEDGTPCSFWIHETIRNIKRGTRFFRKITSVEVFADGYISNCPNENENHFELSGTLCVE